jgi:hypothetical protein
MNNITPLNAANPGTEIATQTSFGSQGLLLDFEKVRAMQAMAEIMSTAAIAVPAHFRGKPGDCLAVVMQAAQWGMNPFAVAQKTHVVNGALGYEAQLVNAVVQESGAIDGRFHYEFRGDGQAIECRVGAKIRGERDLTWGEWLNATTVTTKNSPLWKTNPKQQLGYLQVKNWARLYAPGAILGVYSADEMEQHQVREMGDAEVVTEPPKPESRTESLKSKMGVGKRKVTLESVLKAICAAQNSADLHTAAGQAANLGSDDDKARARAAYSEKLADLKRAAAVNTETGEVIDVDDAQIDDQGAGGDFVMTYAEVASKLQKAANEDRLAEAADLIQYVDSATQRDELGAIYKARASVIRGE